MGIPSIDRLYMMERTLYPEGVRNYDVPSSINGYMGNTMNAMGSMNSIYNPAFCGGYGYPNYNNYYAQNDATRVANNNRLYDQNPNVDFSRPSFTSLNDDFKVLVDNYVNNLSPSESILSAATGGITLGLMNNPRLILHPWNSIKSIGEVEKMFAGIKKDGSVLNKLWNDKAGGYDLLRSAYFRTHKLESLHNSKLGLFRKGLSDAEYKNLKTIMEKALASGTPEEIAKATEQLKRATNAFTGYIPKGLRDGGLQKPMTWLRKKINGSHYQPLNDVVAKNITEAGSKKTFAQFMRHSCGIGNGLLFAGIEFLTDLGNITSAFQKDSQTGWKQVGQTTVKGVGSAVGWAVGEGIGAWAGAKLGAMAGTAIAPGVGTVVGAVAGLIGGSIGMWFTGKITRKICGPDAGAKANAEKMAQTKEGQAQLLQLTLQQAQEGKKLDPKVLQAVQNIAMS